MRSGSIRGRVAPTLATGFLTLLVALGSFGCLAAPVYVANGGSTVVRVDSSSGVTIGSPLVLGYSPGAVAVSPAGDRVYVVNSNSGDPTTAGSVSVVSLPDWRVVATVSVGSNARNAALSPNGELLFVTSSLMGCLRGFLWAIDTATLAARFLPVGMCASGVAVDPSGTVVYVGTQEGVAVVSAATLKLEHTISLQAPGDSGARDVAMSPDGRYLYVAELIGSFTEGNVVVVDTAARSVVARIPIAGYLDTLALSHDGQRLYVANRNSVHSVTVLSTAERRVVAQVALGAMVEGLALTQDDRELWVMLRGARLVAVDTATLAVTKSVAGLTGAASRGRFIGPRAAPAGTAPVVEYYHQSLDHYFVTQYANEIQGLDRGSPAGWARTGLSFFAHPRATGTEVKPVCRYYGLPEAGLNSHFYSASADECAQVAGQFPDAWRLETDEAFAIAVPSAAGTCAAGTEPVYRLWNNRADSNHRYVTHAGVRAEMVARGYVSEGYGPLGVAMCATAAD